MSKQNNYSHAIFPDYRTKGWRRAKWTQIIIASSLLPVLGIAYLISKSGLNGYWTIGALLIGMYIFPLITRGLLWRFVVRHLVDDPSAISHNLYRPAVPVSARPPVDMGSNPRELMKLSPEEFEHEIAWVFEQLYPVQAEVTGGAGDEGIDVKVYDKEGTLRAIVQAKRHNPRRALPPTHLRDLDSCRRRYGVSKAFLVTTSYFSEDTKTQAAEWHINLIDGSQFNQMRLKAREKGNTPIIPL